MESIARAVQKARGTAQAISTSRAWKADASVKLGLRQDNVESALDERGMPADRTIELDEAVLRGNRIVAFDADTAPSRHYDLLRNQIIHGHSQSGALIVAVASAASGNGATVTAANLAFAFARNPAHHVVLVANAAEPNVALNRYLGVADRDRDPDASPTEVTTLRVADVSMKLLSFAKPEHDGAQALMQIARATRERQPTIVIIDLPALPTSDAAMSYVSVSTDVVVVLATDETTLAEVQSCKSLLGRRDGIHYVLNKSGSHGL